MSTKKIILRVLLSLTFFGVTFLVYEASQPIITVRITSTLHDPLDLRVTINEAVIVPSGPEGRSYIARVGQGDKKIIVSGPFIKQTNIDVSLSYFDNRTIEISPESETPETIIASVIGGQSIRISDIKTFKKDAIIVGFIERDQIEVEDSYPSIIKYDTDSRSWLDITEGYFLNRDNYRLSEEVKTYISELSSD